jgi:hypothetical protein
MNPMTPQEIKQLMRELRLTQQGLADTIGAHPITIADWTRGASTPRGLYLKALMDLAAKTRGERRRLKGAENKARKGRQRSTGTGVPRCVRFISTKEEERGMDITEREKIACVRLRKAGVPLETVAMAFDFRPQQVAAYVAWETMNTPEWQSSHANKQGGATKGSKGDKK